VWNVKIRVITVIVGATGTISKSFRKYMSTITGNREGKELQKTSILGTAHILRKVLMYKHIRTDAGASDMGAIKSSGRIAATLYFLGKCFVSELFVCINTLHKGDCIFNYNNNNNNNNKRVCNV
jgi:hypothetical protein